MREARSKLRRRLPTAIELVCSRNYNALAIGFASSERMSDAIVSLAVYARGVNLYFIYGAALADPHHLLLWQRQPGPVRPPRVGLDTRPARDRGSATAAIEEGETPLPRRGRGRVIIKSVSPKQRARRR